MIEPQVAVILARLDALKVALDAQPDRTPEVEWEFDRVRRAVEKLARSKAAT